MSLSPFHALYKARELSNYAYGRDKFLSVFASSNLEAYPYQIAAARFALRSPYLKGVILCDEGSLGKSYEAMLAVAQLWYEGKERIIFIIPTPLMHQWMLLFENYFSVPFTILDNNTNFEEHLENGLENPFLQEGVILTSYDFVTEKADYIAKLVYILFCGFAVWVVGASPKNSKFIISYNIMIVTLTVF